MKKIEDIKNNFESDLKKIDNLEALEKIEIKYLGRKGEIAEILRSLGSFDLEKRKEIGQKANRLKNEIEGRIKVKRSSSEKSKKNEGIDITAPGSIFPEGHLHPLTLVYRNIFNIFTSMGFSIEEGPEIETDWYNFESLNMPKHHPARDTQDSFYFDGNLVLRTQTSPIQIRYMEKNRPPIRIVAFGKTYRRDSDITHTPMFHQMEGLMVDEKTTFADLKGILTLFVEQFFGSERKVRFRPHHFPFTEPSAEMDVSCGICNGKGCRSCKHTGWLEILGAGMVHPNVLRNGGIDPEKYQGFAFGVGIERLVMLKYGIDDLRLFYEGDLRFVEQF